MAGRTKLTGKNHDDAMRLLADVCGALDDAGVKYCLDAGTLLGVIRENRLLPWDNDLDLAIARVEFPKLDGPIAALREMGYRVRVLNHTREDPPMLLEEVRIVKVSVRRLHIFRGVQLDIFVKTKTDDTYTWAEGIRRYARKSVPARFHDELGQVEFAGRSYPIPADADGYLTHRYGDWRTPKKDWDHIHDDEALASRAVPSRETP